MTSKSMLPCTRELDFQKTRFSLRRPLRFKKIIQKAPPETPRAPPKATKRSPGEPKSGSGVPPKTSKTTPGVLQEGPWASKGPKRCILVLQSFILGAFGVLFCILLGCSGGAIRDKREKREERKERREKREERRERR